MKTTTDRKALPERPDRGAQIERKTLACEVKAANDDGTFELYALAFGNVDRGGDIIAPGAVSNVDELVKDGVGLLNHSASGLPVAYADAASQDAKGLLVRGKFHSHPEAQALRSVVRERMDAGKSAQCSIGYIVDDAAFETRGGKTVRILKSIRIYEFSFVNIAMNPEAGVVSAKSLESDPMDQTERGLIAAIKRAVGLETKAGKAISAANHDELSRHASGMADTVENMKEHHKGMKALCKKMGEEIGGYEEKHAALLSFLDSHRPGKDDDDDGDDDSSDEGDTDADRRKAAPRAEAKSTPPPAPDRHAIAAALAGISLPD